MTGPEFVREVLGINLEPWQEEIMVSPERMEHIRRLKLYNAPGTSPTPKGHQDTPKPVLAFPRRQSEFPTRQGSNP